MNRIEFGGARGDAGASPGAEQARRCFQDRNLKPSPIKREAAAFVVKVVMERGLHMTPSEAVASHADYRSDGTDVRLLLNFRAQAAVMGVRGDQNDKSTGRLVLGVVEESCDAKDCLEIPKLMAGQGSILTIIAKGGEAFEKARRIAEGDTVNGKKIFEVLASARFEGEDKQAKAAELAGELRSKEVPEEVVQAVSRALGREFGC